MSEYLQSQWNELTKKCLPAKHIFFKEVLDLYHSEGRHYHNTEHIEALLRLTDKYETLLENPDTIRFAIWYHDVIYDAASSSNEQESAELAEMHLKAMGVSEAVISDCSAYILATKNHKIPGHLDSFDLRFFLDIDLSILAAPYEIYLSYTKQIRKEYSMYPDMLYSAGRKKVLRHFMDSEQIYHTDLFFDLFEEKARKNMMAEYELLS